MNIYTLHIYQLIHKKYIDYSIRSCIIYINEITLKYEGSEERRLYLMFLIYSAVKQLLEVLKKGLAYHRSKSRLTFLLRPHFFKHLSTPRAMFLGMKSLKVSTSFPEMVAPLMPNVASTILFLSPKKVSAVCCTP